MYFTCVLLIFTGLGSVSTRQAEINLNRTEEISNDLSPVYHTTNIKNRRYTHNNLLSDDNDIDYSSRYKTHSRFYTGHSMKQMTGSEDTFPLNQPREDPRLFYQSDAYLKEVKGQNINHEVAAIYPGREVVRADDEYKRPGRLRKMIKSLTLDSEKNSLCVQCPRDRTLIAKAGTDKVFLQNPHLTFCSGRRVSRQIRFVHLYGPKFGTLLQKGSHMIIGKIMYNYQALQVCKIQVHVILQSCPVPKTLKVHCNERTKFCNFTCRDTKLELKGPQTLICGDDLNWEGNLPACRARNWCMPQQPPEHGRISCKGATVELSPGLLEGSRCRVRCAVGWRSSRNTVAICRRGTWTHELQCQPRHNRR